MDSIIICSFYVAILIIGAAVFTFFLYAYRQEGKVFNLATLFLFSGTIFLVLTLLLSGLSKHRHPTTDTFESYNFLALLILIIYFVAGYRFKIRMLGVFLPPIAFLLMLISVLVPKASFELSGFFSTALLSIHVAFSLLGEACFALSFFTSLMYLIQDSNIKHKKLEGLFFKFPSLRRLEKTAGFALLVGYPFLTVGLLLGFLHAFHELGGVLLSDPKIIWSLLTWVIYTTIFVMRLFDKIRGKKFILLLAMSFVSIIICYAAANYFSGFHSFIFSFGAIH